MNKSFQNVSLSLSILIMSMVLCCNSVSGQEIDIETDVYLLGEPHSEEVLISNNAHDTVYPASITKIMTLLLVLESVEAGDISLEEKVTIPREAQGVPGTTIFLEEGEQLTVEELIIAVAVGSANDATIALADHLSGNVDAFVDLMNQRASELEMTNTHFENPHGLHHDQHVTTAYDIFLMAQELLKFEYLHDWFSIWVIEEFLEDKRGAEEAVLLSNTNRMIHTYPGCDGLKTGFTEESQHSITATAERDGERYIAILMGSNTSEKRFEEAKTLLDHGFNKYQTYSLLDKGDRVTSTWVDKGDQDQLPMIAGDDLVVVIEKDEELELQEEKITKDETLVAPITKGEKVASYEVVVNHKKFTVPLRAKMDVEKAGFMDYFGRLFRLWTNFGIE